MPADFDLAAYRANLFRSAPFALAVPVVLGLLIVRLGVAPDAGALVAGALGWVAALMIRAPLAVAVMRALQHDRMRGDPIVAAAAGVIQELVRLVVLVTVGPGFAAAVWVGLGWGAAQAAWALASDAAILSLMGDDPEREQPRSLLPSEEASAPLWGVVERVWLVLVQIGFTLLVAASSLLVVVTAVAHAALNVAVVRWGPVLGLARLQAVGFGCAGVVLGAAWLAWSAAAR